MTNKELKNCIMGFPELLCKNIRIIGDNDNFYIEFPFRDLDKNRIIIHVEKRHDGAVILTDEGQALRYYDDFVKNELNNIRNLFPDISIREEFLNHRLEVMLPSCDVFYETIIMLVNAVIILGTWARQGV